MITEKFTWIYSEDVGNGNFGIAQGSNSELLFIYMDKHGIANIFKDMPSFMDYWDGDFTCERECVEFHETDIEGYDFVDQWLDNYFAGDDHAEI